MKYLLLIATLCTLFAGARAYADGYAQKLDLPVGDYIANLDYDAPASVINSQALTDFSFQLWNKDRTALVDFSDVWVSISDPNSNSVFYGIVTNPSIGGSAMGYMFPTGGTYQMTVSFEKGNATLARATFNIPVQSSSAVDPKQIALVALLCVAVASAAYALGRWHRRLRSAEVATF